MRVPLLLVLTGCARLSNGPGVSPPPATPAGSGSGSPPTPGCGPYDGPELACDADLDCVEVTDLGFTTTCPYPRFWDVTGDGELDLVLGSAAYPLPGPGGVADTPSTWFTVPAGPTYDYDGDGYVDLCGQSGVWAGPFAGGVDGPSDYDAPDGCPTDDFDGDGIGDVFTVDTEWSADSGYSTEIDLRRGPFAGFDSPVSLAVEYAEDTGDPALSSCYGDYGFFDETNDFEVYAADVLPDAGAETVIRDRQYWYDLYGGCPLAEPLVATGGIGPTQTVDATSAGELVHSLFTPRPLPDVDGDGIADLLLESAYQPSTVVRGPSDAVDGSLVDAGYLGVQSGTYIPDVDGDGRADVLRIRDSKPRLVVSSGDGRGGWTTDLVQVPMYAGGSVDYDPRSDYLSMSGVGWSGLIRRTDLAAFLAGR